MLKFLVGPALVGAGCLAGSIYGADAEQIVRKSPSVTYAAVEQALANVRQSGTTFFDGGTPISYELKIDRTFDQRLVVTLFFAGKQGAAADLVFTPRDGGKDTLMTAKIHGEDAVCGRRSQAPTRRGWLTRRTGCLISRSDRCWSNSRPRSSRAPPRISG